MDTPMSVFVRSLISFVLLAVSSSTVFSQDLFENREPVPFVFMQAINPGQTVGQYPILTVGGKYKLVDAETKFIPSNHALANIGAVDIRDGKLFAAYFMTANLEEWRSSDWTDEPCKRNDYLWKSGTGFRNINCVTISHVVNFFRNPTGHYQQIYAQFRDSKIDIPRTVVRVVFTRYSDRGRRLVYEVNFNPEAFGLAPEVEPIWGANSWHRKFIEKYPKKVAFIAGLRKWAEVVQTKMDAAFDHKEDAFSDIPPVEVFLSPAAQN